MAKSITAGFGGLPSEISEEENEQERSFLLYGSSLTRDKNHIRIITVRFINNLQIGMNMYEFISYN